jgi:hypothetical protein
MFDELKKKFGFGSSKMPETFPDPTKQEMKEKAEAMAEESLLGPGGYEERLKSGKRMRHDFKHGPGAFDLKEVKHRALERERDDMDIKKAIMDSIAGTVPITPGMGLDEYHSKIADAKRVMKRKISSDEMSRRFKDTAHGPGDSISTTFGTTHVRPEMVISASGITVMGPDGKPRVEIGELGAGMAIGGLTGMMSGGIAPSVLSSIGASSGSGKSTVMLEELKRIKDQQDRDRETSEMKRMTRDFVQGVGEEMTNAIASAHVRGEACEFAGEVLKRLMVAAQNNGINIHELLEEVEMTEEEKSKEAVALEALAKAVTEYWASPDYELDQTQFSLSGPVSLTILRAPSETHKSGYGKKAHIGGEEFIGEKAYLGKRGQIICCFKPVGVEDYSVMEMALGDCFAQLTGFQKHFVENGFSAQFQAIRDAKNQEKQAADLEKFSANYEDFGSF